MISAGSTGVVGGFIIAGPSGIAILYLVLELA
jgi:hypothetical protein